MHGELAVRRAARRPSVRQVLVVWCERVRVRRELRQLPERLARDMGLPIDELERERRLPFWRSGNIVP